jgi:hypothetical protein
VVGRDVTDSLELDAEAYRLDEQPSFAGYFGIRLVLPPKPFEKS